MEKTYSIIIAIITGAISYSILVIIKLYLNEDTNLSDVIYFYITIGSVIFIAMFYILYKYSWRWLGKLYKKQINEEVNKKAQEMNENLLKKMSIVKIYNNMDECMQDICEKLKTKEYISIFVQIGTQILAGKGKLYDCIMKNKDAKSIRILHSSVRTTYLSSKKAEQREKGKLEQWHLSLKNSEDYGKQLIRIFGKDIFKIRAHHEGFYFRIFLFEDICFVQPYIYESDNSHKAPVFAFNNSENSPYYTFKAFFNNKWYEYKPNTHYINDYVKEAFPISVTAFLKYKNLFIFIIPKRYIKTDSKEVFAHAIGGKTEENETYKTALIREVKEEIDVDINILSSENTLYIDAKGTKYNEIIKDNPAPSIIYKRDYLNSKDKRVKWILVYNSVLNIESLDSLKPKKEIEAIICITREMLLRITDKNDKVLIKDIYDDADSKIIINNKIKIRDYEIKAEGMMPIIANTHLIDS